MARPPRIEIPGAVYLLSSRCDPGVAACVDDADRRALLGLVAQTMQRFDAQVLAYCLLPIISNCCCSPGRPISRA